MKYLLIVSLAVVLLSQHGEANWWRRAGDWLRQPVPYPLGKRDTSFADLIEDEQLSPEEVEELLGLDTETVMQLFAVFDTDGTFISIIVYISKPS
ncbi:hypothetical protein SNE40_005305 [Patella caerulea]|uniref:Uncharacterized protein n=1 Tax=Patella caerulea TaxID=87958 RepID=A0AAN8K2P3_PATCE